MENTVALEKSKKYLRASDVAELLDVSLAFAYRLMQNGTLPSVRIAGIVRVDPVDLKAYIESCKMSNHR